MKYLFPFCFLFFCFSAFAQQTPYQAFDVDSVAEPRGGVSYLTTFIQANLRKPIAAEAEGIGGSKGSIAGVTVSKDLGFGTDEKAKRVAMTRNIPRKPRI